MSARLIFRLGQMQPLCSVSPLWSPRLECHLRLCTGLGLPVRSLLPQPLNPGTLFLTTAQPTAVCLSPLAPRPTLREASYRSLTRASEAVSPGNCSPKRPPGVFGTFQYPRAPAPPCPHREQSILRGRACWSQGRRLGPGRAELALARGVLGKCGTVKGTLLAKGIATASLGLINRVRIHKG